MIGRYAAGLHAIHEEVRLRSYSVAAANGMARPDEYTDNVLYYKKPIKTT